MMLSAFALTVFLTQQPATPPPPPRLTLPAVAFAASAAADWSQTYRMLHAGGGRYVMREANPVLRWADGKPKAMLAMGIAGDAAGLWAWHKWQAQRHPKVYATGLYVASAFRVYLAYLNVKTIRSVRP